MWGEGCGVKGAGFGFGLQGVCQVLGVECGVPSFEFWVVGFEFWV